ncbi:hypothetical protein N7486_006667 [Penicillium sp. IBT 16267x]|nr:hypothetical protein N7486_006667 [Penicillium sp. IBT 16267x]
MHWDAYCAICGSTFSYSWTLRIDFDDENELSYSREVIGNSDLKWLSTLRALGYNASSTKDRVSNTFVSTLRILILMSTDLSLLAQVDMRIKGIIEAAAGKDPNVPVDEDGQVPMFSAYINPGDPGIQVVFPFHEVCYEKILRRCFKNKVINTDVLYAVFKEKQEDSWNRLVLDYGNPRPPSGNYWECRKGQEVLVMHPVDIPQLKKPPYRRLKDFLNWGKKEDSGSRTVQYSQDIFAKLPSELQRRVLDLLPVQSVLALKAASFSMHVCPDISLNQRLETDMPWLWEMYLDGVDLVKSQAAEGEFSMILAAIEKRSRYTEGRGDIHSWNGEPPAHLGGL